MTDRRPFSLRARIESIRRAMPGAGVDDVSRKVWESLIQPDLLPALREALPLAVAQVITPPPDDPEPIQPPPPQPPARPAADSWKTKASRQYAAAWLARPVRTTGRSKVLADCTDDDLRGAAIVLKGEAAWYQLIASKLEAHGAKTVEQLPADVLAQLDPAARP